MTSFWFYSHATSPAPRITSALGTFKSVGWFLNIFFWKMVYSIFMDILSAYIIVHHKSAWCLRRLEEGIGSPGIRTTEGYELHVGSGN